MPIFEIMIESLDGKAQEDIELTGSKLNDFTSIRRSDMNQLNMNPGGSYPIHMFLGDKMYCKIRTEEVFKGNPGDRVVEGPTFGGIIHDGNYSSEQCLFVRQPSDYERLYSLDILGVEDRGENDQLDIYREFQENITKTTEGRYELSVPWVSGATMSSSNLEQSRKWVNHVWRKVNQDQDIKKEYEDIVVNQLKEGIVERAPKTPTGKRLFYMPPKPVVKRNATTTKVRLALYSMLV